MNIGEVIRHYRKAQNLTQEDVARRLGVTAPAVNKWERGATLPDIALLAPLARLFGISCDTLLVYKETLTTEEINHICQQTQQMLEQQEFAAVLQWAQKQMAEYPNCEQLTLNLAILLNSWCVVHLPEERAYDALLQNYLEPLLNSNNPQIRSKAAETLFNAHLRRDDYAQAEKYLTYFPPESFNRRLYQALIYSKTDRAAEAWADYEQLLFSTGNQLSLLLHQLYTLAKQEEQPQQAHMLAEKQVQLASLMEMGQYHEAVDRFDYAVWQQDAATVVQLMEQLLNTTDSLCAYIDSPLFAHMPFKQLPEEFKQQFHQKLLDDFRCIEDYPFIKEDTAAYQKWKKITASV